MKSTITGLQYLLIILLIICLIGFVCIFCDSMDFEFNISRIKLLNNLAPFYLYPLSIFLSIMSMIVVGNHLKTYRKENIYSKSLSYFHPISWWIPLFHFVGVRKSMMVIKNDAEQVLDKQNLKRLTSGIRWVIVGFIIFYSMVMIGIGCDYMNDNRDSYDFLLNTIYLNMIVIIIGQIKINRSVASSMGGADPAAN